MKQTRKSFFFFDITWARYSIEYDPTYFDDVHILCISLITSTITCMWTNYIEKNTTKCRMWVLHERSSVHRLITKPMMKTILFTPLVSINFRILFCGGFFNTEVLRLKLWQCQLMLICFFRWLASWPTSI